MRTGGQPILVDSAVGLPARRFDHRITDKLEAYLPNSAGSRTSTPLCHLRHALAIHPHLAHAFDTRENVVHRLAANAHEFRAYNPRHKITRKIQNLLWRRSFESLAKNRAHCPR